MQGNTWVYIFLQFLQLNVWFYLSLFRPLVQQESKLITKLSLLCETSHSVWAKLLQLLKLQPARLLCPRDSPGKAIHSSILVWRILDRRAWQATIHRITKSRKWLRQLSSHTSTAWLVLQSKDNFVISFDPCWTKDLKKWKVKPYIQLKKM